MSEADLTPTRRSSPAGPAASAPPSRRRLLDDGWRVVVPWVAERELERVERHERLELVQADLFDPAPRRRSRARRATRRARSSTSSAASARAGACTRRRSRSSRRSCGSTCAPAWLVTRRGDAGDARGARGCGRLRVLARRAASLLRRRRLRARQARGARVRRRADAEYSGDGIRANAILPSVIDTPANRASMPDADPSRWVTARADRRDDRLPRLAGGGRDERRPRPRLRPRVSVLGWR